MQVNAKIRKAAKEKSLVICLQQQSTLPRTPFKFSISSRILYPIYLAVFREICNSEKKLTSCVSQDFIAVENKIYKLDLKYNLMNLENKKTCDKIIKQ